MKVGALCIKKGVPILTHPPLYRLLKELSQLGKQPNVLAFEGVRAEESSTRATYARIGRGVKHGNVVNVTTYI